MTGFEVIALAVAKGAGAQAGRRAVSTILQSITLEDLAAAAKEHGQKLDAISGRVDRVIAGPWLAAQTMFAQAGYARDGQSRREYLILARDRLIDAAAMQEGATIESASIDLLLSLVFALLDDPDSALRWAIQSKLHGWPAIENVSAAIVDDMRSELAPRRGLKSLTGDRRTADMNRLWRQVVNDDDGARAQWSHLLSDAVAGRPSTDPRLLAYANLHAAADALAPVLRAAGAIDSPTLSVDLIPTVRCSAPTSGSVEFFLQLHVAPVRTAVLAIRDDLLRIAKDNTGIDELWLVDDRSTWGDFRTLTERPQFAISHTAVCRRKAQNKDRTLVDDRDLTQAVAVAIAAVARLPEVGGSRPSPPILVGIHPDGKCDCLGYKDEGGLTPEMRNFAANMAYAQAAADRRMAAQSVPLHTEPPVAHKTVAAKRPARTNAPRSRKPK
ncbi:hypothetical protein [Humibacillus xanthopallidus]|uniref:Uncharacterized protein n=1 Tax=Humibacillus xanthopallidus TaxID=412689 RepID=A0A543I3L0_9MICO|nr:hypothetical protein [Humibacillus xanthopallidus]TQM65060.1 hypothetical protein FBY41_1442 [Humibacillus xanthopallidus]